MTDEQLTAGQLAEWERLCAAATPGPWRGEGEESPPDEYTRFVVAADGVVVTDEIRGGDCAFIAAAREAVPALIAEVRRLRTLVIKGGELV